MRSALRNRGLAGVVVLASVALMGAAAARLMTLTPDSKVWVEGTSTVRDWKCEATALESEVVPTSEETAALPVEALVQSAQVAIEVATLECGNGKMNEHMVKALKTGTIEFKLNSYAIDGSKAVLLGTLKIAGTTKDIEIPGTVTQEGSLVRVKASKEITMSQWGVKPPSLMMGTMKVKDAVTVGFDVTLKP